MPTLVARTAIRLVKCADAMTVVGAIDRSRLNRNARKLLGPHLSFYRGTAFSGVVMKRSGVNASGRVSRLRTRGIRRATRLFVPPLASLLVTMSLVVLVPTQEAGAATQLVTNCNDSGPGSLRAAIAAAGSGDTISFSVSVLCPPGSPITLTSGPIDITTNITIAGPGPNKMAVSGDNTSQVFLVDSSVTDAVISGLTIENGNATSGTCTSSCSANGGGIVNLGTLTITHSTVSNNSVSTPDCTGYPCFPKGGGMDNEGTVSVSDSTFSDNSTAACASNCNSHGGGIYNNGNMTVTNSTVADNEASTSGCTGICNGEGGGIFNDSSGTLALTNDTVSGNSGMASLIFGGGIVNLGSATIRATIVANNTASAGGDCFFAVTDLGNNLDDDGTCGFTLLTRRLRHPVGSRPGGTAETTAGPHRPSSSNQAARRSITWPTPPCARPPTSEATPASPPVISGPMTPTAPPRRLGQVARRRPGGDEPLLRRRHSPHLLLPAPGVLRGVHHLRDPPGRTTAAPGRAPNSISVVLDDDGNVTVVVDGRRLRPGTDLIEADLTVAPFLTALTTLEVEPPAVTPGGERLTGQRGGDGQQPRQRRLRRLRRVLRGDRPRLRRAAGRDLLAPAREPLHRGLALGAGRRRGPIDRPSGTTVTPPASSTTTATPSSSSRGPPAPPGPRP